VNPAPLELLRQKVRNLDRLPVLPAVLRNLTELMSEDPEMVNLDRVIDAIQCDQSLAAQCLRTANSALFSARTNLESLRQAVLALGMWRVRDLVYSCTLPKLFSAVADGMVPAVFWRHALGTALVSQRFAQRLGVGHPEKIYLAGLLHDLGILVNSMLCPEEFHQALRQAEELALPLREAELQVLGFSHCESGRILAEVWKLAPDLADVIQFHHLDRPEGPAREIIALVHLADTLCRVRDLGYGYYEAREFDLLAEPSWRLLAEKYPGAARLDLVRFTFEMDEFAVEVRSLVDELLFGKPAEVRR
jgi:HD-like signal output (HDOD) protein